MINLKKIIAIVAITFLTFTQAEATQQFVAFDKGDMMLSKQNAPMQIAVSDNDNIGVKLALKNLCNDFKAVNGANVSVSNTAEGSSIIVGTLGNSALIDQMAKQGKIDAAMLKGKTEKYIITIVDGRLVIAGSDRRGTIYGIYELSRQIGVSPWYYWMDVPVEKHGDIYVNKGIFTDGEPAVRYRGIFLNDEAPCLTTWVKNTFGTNYGGHKFYEKVFELLLRLKGNYIWPAMWGWAFYADDPLNGKTADDMGIMIGTSHHEPMCRSQKEWHGHSDNPNADTQDLKSRREQGGKWDYATNKANLDKFWYGGVERNKTTEDIITIGMRGDGDMAMSEERNVKLLESVIANQRKLISKARGKKASQVPQLWALYKEVQDYYDDGMRVPDDVTILLCDDNWGNVRRVPTLKERQRKGGWGLYYHVDYVGAPRNSKLLNVTPVQNMWEQLALAYNNGIDKLWILNVGDLKPMEYPIQLFLDLAWYGVKDDLRMKADEQTDILSHVRDFFLPVVGEKEADEATRIFNLLCKYNGRCTPEMLDAKTYSLEPSGRIGGGCEWETVCDEYKTLEIAALEQYSRISADARDAYFQSVLFPVQLMSTLHQMYYAQAMNNALYKKGDAAMDIWAEKCEKAFKRDGELMSIYNKVMAGGKWNGMMIQKHIGYKIWNDNFRHDTQPTVYRAKDVQNIFETDGKGYISMEAAHYNSAQGEWMEIPFMGRTLSGMTLRSETGALTYKFRYDQKTREIIRPKVTIVTKSTLDYLNKGGMTYSVAIDGGEPVTVNFNKELNEHPDNIYSIYYPTVARRIVEKTVELPLGSSADGIHTLTFTPNDPRIVLEKVVIDFGGYTPQYLFGTESLRK